MNNNHPHIFLVEDDVNLGFVIRDNLQQNNMNVSLYEDGITAFNAFNKSYFDLCILDVMLPKMDGFVLAEKIRVVNSHIPILFLTARGAKEDRLKGFATGGDDYITKPFSIEELLMRIEVFLKRSFVHKSDNANFSIGKYSFEYSNLKLSLQGDSEKKLTQMEADVLKCLAQHQGDIVKRETLLFEVWGDDDYFNGRSLDVFISKLRKYLGNDPSLQIENIHGVGFRLRD